MKSDCWRCSCFRLCDLCAFGVKPFRGMQLGVPPWKLLLVRRGSLRRAPGLSGLGLRRRAPDHQQSCRYAAPARRPAVRRWPRAWRSRTSRVIVEDADLDQFVAVQAAVDFAQHGCRTGPFWPIMTTGFRWWARARSARAFAAVSTSIRSAMAKNALYRDSLVDETKPEQTSKAWMREHVNDPYVQTREGRRLSLARRLQAAGDRRARPSDQAAAWWWSIWARRPAAGRRWRRSGCRARAA